MAPTGIKGGTRGRFLYDNEDQVAEFPRIPIFV